MSRVPRQIAMEISTRCNINCTLCPTRADSMKKEDCGYMDTELCKSIIVRLINEGLHNTSIALSVNGESMMHPDIWQILKWITDAGIQCYLTTNSSIWDEKVFQLMTEKNSFYQIVFSVAGLYDTRSCAIEKGMPGLDRWKSKKNIEEFIKLWRKKGNNLEVGIKTCRRGQDQEELEHLVEYWLDKGVSFVALGRPLIDTENGMRMYPCRYFDDMALYVRSNGVVYPCTYNTKITNEDWLRMGVLDKTIPLLKFYNNEMYEYLRYLHYVGVFPNPCDRCGIAYTGDGWIGEVKFRNTEMTQKTIYMHDDYSNTFYSYEPKKQGISFKRTWEPDPEIVDRILADAEKLNFDI